MAGFLKGMAKGVGGLLSDPNKREKLANTLSILGATMQDIGTRGGAGALGSVLGRIEKRKEAQAEAAKIKTPSPDEGLPIEYGIPYGGYPGADAQWMAATESLPGSPGSGDPGLSPGPLGGMAPDFTDDLMGTDEPMVYRPRNPTLRPIGPYLRRPRTF